MKIDLNGKWILSESGIDGDIAANVPGCNYTDLLTAGAIKDPFIGTNERDVLWVGERDWQYSRVFELDAEACTSDIVELVAESLDTLASVFINDALALIGNNTHRRYVIDIKPFIKTGSNLIKIVFLSPVRYAQDGQRIFRFPRSNMSLPGAPYVRKAQCHFGWDWGPVLPLSGITKSIYINCINVAKIEDVRVIQDHDRNKVTLNIDIASRIISKESEISAQVNITAPDGIVTTVTAPVIDDMTKLSVKIVNPELWEANGMSNRTKQPLYQVEATLISNGTTVDKKRINVGLRTITLNTAKDKWGSTFQFIVNGVPIFARGADWIPADSFPARITKEKLDYILRSVRDSNMNMLRVWGGGFYESEEFYDACDSYGILVWQDFCFACNPYPFFDKDFLENVRNEVIDNVLRLRNRASLALWCGNNEIEALSLMWRMRRDFIDSTGVFFYEQLPLWVNSLDGITPYWPGSPSSGEYLKEVGSDDKGDTHLWQVWHGLRPYNYYRKRLTRFCSEFGFESIPDIETVSKFARPEDYDMKSPVMLNHQKCNSGNDKIIYYITSRLPKEFKDLVYLSQISQMECVRDATEHWRRNSYRCNGSLYWQLNDCWPVNSWASMDYYGRWKALQYEARKFNAPVALSIDNRGTLIKVGLHNDTVQHFEGEIEFSLMTFNGEIIDSGDFKAQVPALHSDIVMEKDFSSIIKGREGEVFFSVNFKGNSMSTRTVLFVKEKAAAFQKVKIDVDYSEKGAEKTITLSSVSYSRYVMVKVKGVDTPLSDNYFDLIPGKEKIITFKTDKPVKASDITVQCLNNVIPKQSLLKDRLTKLRIALKPINVLYYLAQLFT